VRLCLRCLILLFGLLVISSDVFAAGPGDARITGHIICAEQAVLPVLRHRVMLRPEAELEGLDADRVLTDVTAAVPVPRQAYPAVQPPDRAR
jgi:hypothetical protein